MFSVITLLLITATSCLVGFQSATIKFKNTNNSTVDAKYTFNGNDDKKFTMKELKFTIPAGETKLQMWQSSHGLDIIRKLRMLNLNINYPLMLMVKLQRSMANLL